MSLSSVPEEQRSLLLAGESAYISGPRDVGEFDVPNYIPQEQKSAVKALIGTMPEVSNSIAARSFLSRGLSL